MTERQALAALAKFRSWRLERLSPTTYPQDITIKLKYLSEGQADAIAGLMKRATCYRCRIGLGRYFFGETAVEAIELAVAKEKGKK